MPVVALPWSSDDEDVASDRLNGERRAEFRHVLRTMVPIMGLPVEELLGWDLHGSWKSSCVRSLVRTQPPRSGHSAQQELMSYQVSGLRTPATTWRIAWITSSGWSWWMSWPLSLATVKRAFGTSVAWASLAALRYPSNSAEVNPCAPAGTEN